MIDKDTFDKWVEMARRDDWHMTFVGSDIRQMLAEIERMRTDAGDEVMRELKAQRQEVEMNNIEERLLDQTSRWVALSEPDPLRLEAAAEIKRLRSSEECLKLAVAALVKNETELKAEIERLRAKNTTIEKEWTIAYTEVERLQSLLANSEMTVKELLANDERLRAALRLTCAVPLPDGIRHAVITALEGRK